MTRNERSLLAAMATIMLLSGAVLVLRIAGVNVAISLGQANSLAIIGTIITVITLSVGLGRKLMGFVSGPTGINHVRWNQEHTTDIDIDRRLRSLERRADISQEEQQEIHTELRQLANSTRQLAEVTAQAVTGRKEPAP